MITVKDLHKTFHTMDGDLPVLKGINQQIEKGEKVVVIGPSGSGKSTFLRCLNLLEQPTDGEIWFEGTQINKPDCDINKLCQKMGMAPSSPTRRTTSTSCAGGSAWCSSILTCSRI